MDLGKAQVVLNGSDVTLIAYGAMVQSVLETAEKVQEEENLSCEVIDLRSLVPWDVETVLESVTKTGRERP